MKNRFYVYVWENLTNGKKYVGKGCGSRAFQHVKDSWKGEGRLLAEAMREEGEHNFSMRIIKAQMAERAALKLERETIQELGCLRPNGYNIQGEHVKELKLPGYAAGLKQLKEQLRGQQRPQTVFPPFFFEEEAVTIRFLACLRGRDFLCDWLVRNGIDPDDDQTPLTHDRLLGFAIGVEKVPEDFAKLLIAAYHPDRYTISAEVRLQMVSFEQQLVKSICESQRTGEVHDVYQP